MAETKKDAESTSKKAKEQGKDGAYYVVNPAGAIHSVSKDHAKWRLSTVGWRMATEDEIATYQKQEIQLSDQPICQPWSPDPDKQIELDD